MAQGEKIIGMEKYKGTIKTAHNTVYNSLLVIAYLRKSSRTFYLPAGRQVCDLFANFSA